MTSMTKKRVTQAVILTLMTLSTAVAGAATHIFINPDVFPSTAADKAFVDVSGEPTTAGITVTVFPTGAPPQTAAVPMNAKNFAVSPDLFALSLHKTALVVAMTSDRSTPSVAVLRLQNGSFREAMAIPSSNRTLGTAFNIPIGDLTGGGNIYVGNNNGVDANVNVHYGASSSPPDTTVRVPSLSAVKIPIPSTQSQSNLILVVTNNVSVVAQVVIGTRFLMMLPIGPAI